MSTTTELSDAEIARRAADHIEKVGLNKASYFAIEDFKDDRSEVPCCTVGAAGLVVGLDNYWVTERAEIDFADAFGDFLNPKAEPDANRFRIVTEWNDAPERTQEEVVAKLREFADYLDSKESDK